MRSRDDAAPRTDPHEGRKGGLRAAIAPVWQTRDLGLLLVARAAMSAARALAGVLVPIYLVILRFDAVQLGALFTAVALVSAGLSALIGLAADRVGRKPFLIALPLLTAVAAVVFGLSRTAPLLFVSAALGSFGRGAGAGAGAVGPYQPAEQAYLADGVPVRHRNDLFGRVAFMSSLGALIGGGPLAALPDLLPKLGVPGMAGHPLAGYRVAFLVMAALALAAGLLATPIAETHRARPARIAVGPRIANPLRHVSRQSWSTLWRLWVTNSVNGLAVGFFGPFITYWYYVRFHAGPAQIGLLYAVINLAAMVSNLYAAPLARRLGLVRAIVVSRSLQAALMIPMVLAPSFWLAGGFYLLRMLAQRVGLPLRQSYVMAVVRREERGTVAALSNLPSQGTSAIGPSIAGELFAHVSLSLPFEVGAALQGLNTRLFYTFFHCQPPPEERSASGEVQRAVVTEDQPEQASEQATAAETSP